MTEQDQLEVRWDFDSDGDWETEFQPISEAVSHFHRRTYNAGFFFASAEVRDESGNTTIETRAVAYPNSYAIPDLIAWSIRALEGNLGSAYRDTVKVGESFRVLGLATCWRDSGADWGTFTSEVTLDGEVIGQYNLNRCPPSFGTPCSPTAYFRHTIQTPGTYELRLELGSPEFIQEASMANNSVSSTLVVLPE